MKNTLQIKNSEIIFYDIAGECYHTGMTSQSKDCTIALTPLESGVVQFFAHHYNINTAIEVFCALRIGDEDSITDAKYMLAPDILDVREDLKNYSKEDIKAILSATELNASTFAQVLGQNQRNMRNKINPDNVQQNTTIAERYLLHTLVNQLTKSR